MGRLARRAAPWRRARRCSPGSRPTASDGAGLGRQPLPPADEPADDGRRCRRSPGPGGRGRAAGRASAPTSRPRRAAIDARRSATTTCCATVGPAPARRRRSSTTSGTALVALAGAPTWCVAVGECGLRLPLRRTRRATTQEAAFRGPDRGSRTTVDRALVDPHARRVGRHVRACSTTRACPSARSSTASPADPTRRAGALDLGALPLVQRHRDVQERRRRARRGRARARSTACWSRPTRRSSRRCRTAGSPTARVGGRGGRRPRRRDGPSGRGGRVGDPPERGRGVRPDPQPRPP